MKKAQKVIDPNPIIEQLADRCLATKGVECYTLGEVIDMLHVAVAKSGIELIPCGQCTFGNDEDCPEGRVWCAKMCRYMLVDGFCSYGNDGHGQ